MRLTSSFAPRIFTLTIGAFIACNLAPALNAENQKTPSSNQQEQTTATKPSAPVAIKSGKGDETLPPIIVAAQEIPMAYWRGGDGHYNKVFDLMVEGYDGTIKTTFLPSERASRMFTSKEAQCSYVHTSTLDMYGEFDINSDDLVFIGPINEIHVTAYVRTGAEDITGPDDLKGKTVAVDVNLVDLMRSQGVKESMALQSQVQMVELLAKERVDVLVGWNYDLDLLAKKLNLSNELQPTSMNLSKVFDGMVCYKGEETNAFIQEAQERLATARSNGTLAAIFAE